MAYINKKAVFFIGLIALILILTNLIPTKKPKDLALDFCGNHLPELALVDELPNFKSYRVINIGFENHNESIPTKEQENILLKALKEPLDSLGKSYRIINASCADIIFRWSEETKGAYAYASKIKDDNRYRITFSSLANFHNPEKQNYISLGRVARHEVGHALGLLHKESGMMAEYYSDIPSDNWAESDIDLFFQIGYCREIYQTICQLK